MDAEQLFLKEGAEFFGNRLIYRNKDVGVKTPTSPLVLTSHGEIVFAELSNITDVEAKPVKAKRPAAKPAPEPEAAVLPDDASLDALLGE